MRPDQTPDSKGSFWWMNVWLYHAGGNYCNTHSFQTLAEHTQTYVPQDSNEKHEKSLKDDVIVRQLYFPA